MVKKYIGKVHSSKFRRKNSNDTKNGRKGRKSRKSRKSRKIMKNRRAGNVVVNKENHLQLTTGTITGIGQSPKPNQIEEIENLLNNDSIDTNYLMRGQIDYPNKKHYPYFLSNDNKMFELRINILIIEPKEAIKKLKLERSNNDIVELSEDQKYEIEQLIDWFSIDKAIPVPPKFRYPGWLRIDGRGYLYFQEKTPANRLYIRRDNPAPTALTTPTALTASASYSSKKQKTNK